MPIAVAQCDPERAPDAWIGYQGVDVLIWDTPQPGALRPAQLRALQEWVLQGGRLLVTLPAAGPLPDLALLDPLLPAQIQGRGEIKIETEPDDALRRLRLPPCLREACAGAWEYDAWARQQDPGLVPAAGATTAATLADLKPTRGRIPAQGGVGTIGGLGLICMLT